jgi:diguanylate cyclase
MEGRTKSLESELQRSSEQVSDLRCKLDNVRKESLTDPLTGIANRKAFDAALEAAINRDDGEAVTLLMLDIDHFKKFNDSYGHLTGDQVLRLVANAVKQNVKGQDISARYGGEEFAVILPQIEAAALATIAERVRALVESLPAPVNGSTLTISIGGALYPEDGTTVDALFHVADERLYQAKRDGRNRVVTPAPTRRSADRQSA